MSVKRQERALRWLANNATEKTAHKFGGGWHAGKGIRGSQQKNVYTHDSKRKGGGRREGVEIFLI